ncbi:hypothetical protein M011DRAFT_476333 [Sporormia fimetaria CBS 119925]|uniref:Uncharacterized protein n=1 Tax=Sporormia fimetaria CBS 119925 TaxID=1340428 RepID=A0A6A6VDN8_9PLEO|nr:hypothetical protein M011DRAFT_476333 [Sporormia fimetaria CBS 119925]
MSSIISAFSDLIQSIVELLWSFVSTAGDLAQKTVAFVARSFNELIVLFMNFGKGLVELAGGLASFLMGNIVVFGVIAVAFFGFLQYQRSQGNAVKVGNKKLN